MLGTTSAGVPFTVSTLRASFCLYEMLLDEGRSDRLASPKTPYRAYVEEVRPGVVYL